MTHSEHYCRLNLYLTAKISILTYDPTTIHISSAYSTASTVCLLWCAQWSLPVGSRDVWWKLYNIWIIAIPRWGIHNCDHRWGEDPYHRARTACEGSSISRTSWRVIRFSRWGCPRLCSARTPRRDRIWEPWLDSLAYIRWYGQCGDIYVFLHCETYSPDTRYPFWSWWEDPNIHPRFRRVPHALWGSEISSPLVADTTPLRGAYQYAEKRRTQKVILLSLDFCHSPSSSILEPHDDVIVISEWDISTEIFPHSWEDFAILDECVCMGLDIFLHEEIGSRIGNIEEYIISRDHTIGIVRISHEHFRISVDTPYSLTQPCIEDWAAIGTQSRIHISSESTDVASILGEEAIFSRS